MRAVAPNWKPVSWKGAPKGKRGTVAISAGDRVLMMVDEDGDGRTAAAWYEPGRDRWTPEPAIDLSFRFRPATAWTGDEVLIWGGRYLGPKFFGDGVQVASEQSSALPKKGALAARAPHAVWTGNELLVWGGTGRKKVLGDGASYRPAEAAWRSLSNDGAPSPREDACAVWTGQELWIYGGIDENRANFDGTAYSDGAAYDPSKDRWRPLPDLPEAGKKNPYMFQTSRGVVLVDASALRAWRMDADARRWARLSIDGKPGFESGEGVDRVHDRLVVRAPLGRAVLDLESLQWLPVPKSPELGSLESITEVAHNGELIFLDGKEQKGARLELYQ